MCVVFVVRCPLIIMISTIQHPLTLTPPWLLWLSKGGWRVIFIFSPSSNLPAAQNSFQCKGAGPQTCPHPTLLDVDMFVLCIKLKVVHQHNSVAKVNEKDIYWHRHQQSAVCENVAQILIKMISTWWWECCQPSISRVHSMGCTRGHHDLILAIFA